ncbi:chloramphenicol phosphotransferase CPT family protein [Thaumasiovibrio subtropicus]|uniref:chloramphenicol phosphotransferase CPT family protein n=1 Tax=Thaumasiovibrio subtropicus TaxID=1891207 RepID=UPI000B35A685|nr:AAA family ATPase [Thaumasiovibrio subtropicus]
MRPDIIILNGTGSAGKTSVAKALQEQLDVQYLNFSIDSVLYALPPSDLHCMMEGKPITRRGYDYAVLVQGYHECVLGLLKSGCRLIIDNAWIEKQDKRNLRSLLSSFNAYYVGVKCDLSVCEQRELARGDRAIGLARHEYPLVHADMEYDIEVDTTDKTPQQAADYLVSMLDQIQN